MTQACGPLDPRVEDDLHENVLLVLCWSGAGHAPDVAVTFGSWQEPHGLTKGMLWISSRSLEICCLLDHEDLLLP